MKQISDPMFDKALQIRFFVDVNETTLNVISVQDNEKNSAVVPQNNNDFMKEIKEMEVNILITGGKLKQVTLIKQIFQTLQSQNK